MIPFLGARTAKCPASDWTVVGIGGMFEQWPRANCLRQGAPEDDEQSHLNVCSVLGVPFRVGYDQLRSRKGGRDAFWEHVSHLLKFSRPIGLLLLRFGLPCRGCCCVVVCAGLVVCPMGRCPGHGHSCPAFSLWPWQSTCAFFRLRRCAAFLFGSFVSLRALQSSLLLLLVLCAFLCCIFSCQNRPSCTQPSSPPCEISHACHHACQHGCLSACIRSVCLRRPFASISVFWWASVCAHVNVFGCICPLCYFGASNKECRGLA